MFNFKKILTYALGRVYIPKEILNCNEKILLHISDTPENFFSTLNSILSKIQPDYIVHTGDLVDNIKLEIYPQKINMYTKKVSKLINILESSSAKEIYLTLGNHDNKIIVNNLTKKCTIFEKSSIIKVEDLNIKISHFPSDIQQCPSHYNLCGHDLTIQNEMENEKIYLNGIISINIILLESKQIFILDYPYGTNDSRLCKRKISF